MVFRFIAIAFVAGACLIASVLVSGIIAERNTAYREAQDDISATWGAPQTMLGPLLVFTLPPPKNTTTPVERYVLPHSLVIESTLTPEVRNRGIYHTVVYMETLKVRGTFATEDAGILPVSSSPNLVLSLTDSRGIETNIPLTWNGADIPFEPGPTGSMFDSAGIHATVPFSNKNKEYTFSFELAIKGASEALFTPVGKETEVRATSPWNTPAFTGAFLPSERTVSDSGFSATWRVSSFGRNYPQMWEGDAVSMLSLQESTFGVHMYEGVDLYTQLSRSIKYAMLFIVITFTVLFLFEVLQTVRVHPIHYLLIGSAIALFYLLLLSFAEHIGFLYAYLIATTMITVLITSYSASVLKRKSRSLFVGGVLLLLYGYLYFILQLEDYALLFGALLLFILLATVMFLTRNVDWFHIEKNGN